ncbi:Esterase EstA precursor [compost metagenome]
MFAEIARELEFEDDRRDLRLGLNSVAGNSFELQGHTPASGQTLAGLGISHALAEELQLRAAYHFRGTDDRQHGLNLSLNWDW